MADDEIDYSQEVQDFADYYNIISCRQTQVIYRYDASRGIFLPLDDVQLSKLADEYLKTVSAMSWCDYNMSILLKYVKTKAPYYKSMRRAGRIVFNNGTFHIQDMQLHKHSPKNRAIAGLGVDYDPTATCPLFDNFIADMANGDSNLAKTLYELAGYVAAGGKEACKLVILVSSGGSGKSVYLKILTLLVGALYSTSLSISEINNPGKAFDRYYLLNSRLNVVHELGEKETLNTIFSANVKKIVSGEEISGEKKYGNRFEFSPQISAIVAASNHCPEFESMPSESIRRRLLILNITKTFSFDEQDPELYNKMKNELPGIFNRVMEYYQILKTEQFVFASEADSRAYVNNKIIETFPMYMFVTERIIAKPGHRLNYEALRQEYTKWAEERDIYVTLDAKSLAKELRNTISDCHIPVTSGKSNGVRYLMGIAMVGDSENI